MKIGQYEITRMDDGSFWIRHESGEGMQCSEDALEDWINQFYEKYF